MLVADIQLNLDFNRLLLVLSSLSKPRPKPLRTPGPSLCYSRPLSPSCSPVPIRSQQVLIKHSLTTGHWKALKETELDKMRDKTNRWTLVVVVVVVKDKDKILGEKKEIRMWKKKSVEGGWV